MCLEYLIFLKELPKFIWIIIIIIIIIIYYIYKVRLLAHVLFRRAVQ